MGKYAAKILLFSIFIFVVPCPRAEAERVSLSLEGGHSERPTIRPVASRRLSATTRERRQQDLANLPPGSTIFAWRDPSPDATDKKLYIRKIPPSGDVTLNWVGGAWPVDTKENATLWKMMAGGGEELRYGPLRKIARETEGLIFIGPGSDVPSQLDVLLDRVSGGASSGQPELDIAVAIDISGSMDPILKNMKAELQRLNDRISYLKRAKGKQIRLALLTFPDTKAGKVVQNFTHSVDRWGEKMESVDIGGASSAEATWYTTAMQATRLPWSPSAERILVMISDAQPDFDTNVRVPSVIKLAKKKNIKIYPVILSTYLFAGFKPSFAGEGSR